MTTRATDLGPAVDQQTAHERSPLRVLWRCLAATCLASLLYALPVLADTPAEPPTPDGGLGRVFGVLASIAFVVGFGRQVRNWWKRRNRQRRLDAERKR